MEITLTNVRDFGAFLVLVSGLLGGYVKWLDTRIRSSIQQTVTPVLNKLEDIEADVADIRHEVNSNSGKSLKDLVGKALDQAAENGTATEVLTARFEDHMQKGGGE